MRRWALAVALLLACKDPPPEVSPKDRAEGHYLKGQSEFLAGRYDEALKEFEQVKQDAPEDPRLPAAMGEVFLLQGNEAEAQKHFEIATRLDPKRATNWSRLAEAQSANGDKDGAVKSLTRALELNPNDFNALEQQAGILVAQGDVDQAAKLLALAGRLAPEYRQGEPILRAYRILVATNRPTQARAVLEDAVDAGTKAADVYGQLGELQVREGDYAAAAHSYELAARNVALQKLPDGGMIGDSGYWEIAGKLWTRLDDLDRARQAYENGVKLDDNATLHVALARLAFLRQDPEAVKLELDRALATARGEDIRETIDLAELLAETGRKKEALMLLDSHASAEDGQQDVELQLKTLHLAKEVKNDAVWAVTCIRLGKLDAGVGCK